MAKLVEGNSNHDAVDEGNPVKIGGVSKNYDGTDPGSVAEADRSHAIFTRDGRMCVETGHPYFFQTFSAYSAAQTNAQLVAAPGTALSLYLTDFIASGEGNAGAGKFSFLDGLTSTGEKIRLRFDTSGSINYSARQPLKLTANTALGVTSEATTTSVFVAGYIAP